MEHYTEVELTAEHYHNVHPEEFNAGTIEFLDLEELDEDYHFSDSEYSFGEVDDKLFSENVDAGAEWLGRLQQHLGLTNEDDISEDKSDSDAGIVDTSDSDFLYMLFEDIFAEDVPGMKKIKWPVYKDCDDPQWEVGMTFKDHHECREAITKHSYKEGRMVRFLLSDRKRLKAACKEPCPWFMFASQNFDKIFQLKQLGPGMLQTCGPLHFHYSLYISMFCYLPCYPLSSNPNCLTSITLLQHTPVLESKGGCH